MTAAREVWQSYDCPVQRTDMDLFDEDMVFKGQAFDCAHCGGRHVAGFGVDIETFIEVDGERRFPDLPETAEDLERLKSG